MSIFRRILFDSRVLHSNIDSDPVDFAVFPLKIPDLGLVTSVGHLSSLLTVITPTTNNIFTSLRCFNPNGKIKGGGYLGVLPDYVANARKWLEGKYPNLVIETFRPRLNPDEKKGFAIVSGPISDREGKKHNVSILLNIDGTVNPVRSGMLDE